MSPKGKIGFSGFGTKPDDSVIIIEDEKEDHKIEQSNIECNDIEKENLGNYRLLQQIREIELNKLNKNSILATVSRDEIYQDLVRFFFQSATPRHIS